MASLCSESAPSTEDHTECAICLELMTSSDYLQTMSCQHMFHAACIIEHINVNENPTCPLCRAPLPRLDSPTIAELNDQATAIFNKIQEKVARGEASWTRLSDADKREMITAIRYWVEGAKVGDVKSSHNVGYVYEHGFGVPQRLDYAECHYRSAASQGHAKSQCNLGLLYFKGANGIQQSYPQALTWLGAAADQNDAQACFNLGKKKSFCVLIRCVFPPGTDSFSLELDSYNHIQLNVLIFIFMQKSKKKKKD
jgi:hypothetical protein